MLQSEQAMGLSQLIGRWMSAPTLQKAMITAGINIFVNEYADNYISTYGKVCTVPFTVMGCTHISDSTILKYLIISISCCF